MEKITKKEYRYALKIVADYEQQESNKKKQSKRFNLYSFLWFSEKIDNNRVFQESSHYRDIKAKDIDSACQKFFANRLKTMTRVDDEVVRYDGHSQDYVDITGQKEFKAWLDS